MVARFCSSHAAQDPVNTVAHLRHDHERGPRLCAVEGLSEEDQKIITLARSVRARTGASEGAAVRDETGRTYAAATVALPSLQLSALRLAVAMAVSSGASSLEAAAVVSQATGPSAEDLAAVADLGPQAPVYHAGSDGRLRATLGHVR
jgi:hypothetical protein